MNTPPDCLHPARTVVIMDILLRTCARQKQQKHQAEIDNDDDDE